MIGLKYSRHLLNQSNRCKTNQDLVTRAFPITCIYFEFSLVHYVVDVFLLWLAIFVSILWLVLVLRRSIENHYIAQWQTFKIFHIVDIATKILKRFYRFQCLKLLAMLHYQGLILKLISCEILYVWVNTAAIEEHWWWEIYYSVSDTSYSGYFRVACVTDRIISFSYF